MAQDPAVRIVGSDLDPVAITHTASLQEQQVVAILAETAVNEPAVLRLLGGLRPTIGIVVLAHRPSRVYGKQMLAAGATCLSMETSAANLVSAVHLAAEGKHMLEYPIYTEGGVALQTAVGSLTMREREVMEYARSGHTNPEIARALHISIETVKTHMARIRQKLGLRSKQELRTDHPAITRKIPQDR